MRRWLLEAWILLGLAFGQTLLTFVFVALVPYGYLLYQARSQPLIAENLEKLTRYAEENAEKEVSGPEILEAMGAPIRELLEMVPWTGLVFLGCLLIYPFLGWWSGRLLHSPQLGGLLVLTSVVSQQNIAMVPRNIEYWNVADVSLSPPFVILFIGLQFALLTAGIMYQRGRALLKTSKESEE